MKARKTVRFDDKDAVVEFYQERYADGYLEDWPIDKKQRIIEVIRSLNLPKKGEAIDFGCGNGALTMVIKQALPTGWCVYGVDISEIAVENAKKRFPECTFYAHGDIDYLDKKFDFVFTHHVLEHVFNLSQAIDDINNHLKNDGALLHILPCGNEGSFEHSIVILRKDGIDRAAEDRFFYEDAGHIRRLNTKNLSDLYSILNLNQFSVFNSE